MFDCLNSDDDDEEAHRAFFSCFVTTRCMSVAEADRTIPKQVHCLFPGITDCGIPVHGMTCMSWCPVWFNRLRCELITG